MGIFDRILYSKEDLLIKAIENDDTPKVNKFLSKGANVNVENQEGMTALWMAIVKDHVELFNFLIENQSKIDFTRYDTPCLVYAATKGNIQIVKALVKLGADVNAQDADGHTALYEAVTHKKFKVVKYLIQQGANVDVQYQHGFTALVFAIRFKSNKIFKVLLEANADVNIIPSTDGYTALFQSVCYNDPDALKQLIKAGADINHKNNDGEKAIRISAREGFTEITNILLKAEKTAFNEKYSKNKTNDKKPTQSANTYERLLKQLHQILKNANQWGTENNWPGFKEYPQYNKLRDIGQQLYNLECSTVNMQKALTHFKQYGNYPPDSSGTGVAERAWAGIGEWIP